MRILHGRTSTDRIAVSSACPNMHVFALASTTSISCYRARDHMLVSSFKLSASASSAGCIATCVAWSPSGTLLGVGFSDGWALILHVESGELLRAFAPRPPLTSSDARWSLQHCRRPPMLPDDGLNAGSSSSDLDLELLVRFHSIPEAERILACSFVELPDDDPTVANSKHLTELIKRQCRSFLQNGSDQLLTGSGRSYQTEGHQGAVGGGIGASQTLLAEAVDTSSLPAGGGSHRVTVFACLSSNLTMSVSLCGLCEVGTVRLRFPQLSDDVQRRLFDRCRDLLLLPRDGGVVCVLGESEAASERLVWASTVDPPPHFNSREATSWLSWKSFVSERRLVRSVMEEYVMMGDVSLSKCIREWQRVSAGALEAMELPHSAESLRGLMIPALTTPNWRTIDALLSRLSLPVAVQAAERLRDALGRCMHHAHRDALTAYQNALAIKDTLLHTNSDDGEEDVQTETSSPSSSWCTGIALKATLTVDVVTAIRMEAEALAELLRWVVQAIQKHQSQSANSAGGGNTGAGPANQLNAGVSEASRFVLEPLRIEAHPNVLRTLHRFLQGGSVVSHAMMQTTLQKLDAAANPVEANATTAIYDAILEALASPHHMQQQRGPSACSSPAPVAVAPVTELLASSSTGFVSGSDASSQHFLSLTLVDEYGSATPLCALSLTIEATEATHDDEATGGSALSPLLVMGIRAAADPHAIPLVSAWAVEGCVSHAHRRPRVALDSGPAPMDVAALRASDLQGGVLAHASYLRKHVVVLRRGSTGIAVAIVEQNGECARLEEEMADDVDGGGVDVLLVDGLVVSSAAESPSSGSVPSCHRLTCSVSELRGFAVVSNSERYVVIDLAP